MDHTYWHKQPPDAPLFPELIWSRPENRITAGKLLIIGGNAHGFAVPAEAYSQAVKTGVGAVRVILPVALQKLVSRIMPEAVLADATISGGFARSALAVWVEQSAWADGVLLAGEFGRNSETGVLLEQYLAKTPRLVTLSGDTLEAFYAAPHAVLDRANTTLVVNLSQLQKLAAAIRAPYAFTLGQDLVKIVEHLHDFSQQAKASIVVGYKDSILVAHQGRVSSTPATASHDVWQTKVSAQVAVWWLQNPSKPFEALSSAVSSSAASA